MRKEPEIEFYTPPRDITEMASERTIWIVRRWTRDRKNTIEELAVSLYLQGLHDAGVALGKI